MKRAIQLFLVICIASIFLISPVAAQTNQGLSWGVSVNDRIDFTFVANTDTDHFSEAMYAEVTATPSIPDSINAWGAVPSATANWKWAANDTSIGLYGLIFLSLLAVGSHMSVPVGNFSLLSTLVSTALTGEELVNDLFYWGITFSYDVTSTTSVTVGARYFKSDGFLAKLTIENFEGDTRTGYVAISRQGIMSTIADNFIFIAIGVVVLIALVVICVKRR